MPAAQTTKQTGISHMVKKGSHSVRLKIASPVKFSKYTRRNWSGKYEGNT